MALRYAFILVLALLTVSVSLAPSAPELRTLTTAPSPVLRIGFLQTVDSLNPYRGLNEPSSVLYGLLYDFPFSYDQDGNPVSNLITSASCANPQCSVWNYTVRSGVRWSDGTALTPEDVNFTYNYDSQNLFYLWAFEPYFNQVVQCAPPTKVTGCGAAIDPSNPGNVTLYFKQPFAAGRALSAPIVEKAQWSSVSPAAAGSTYTNANPIGTGPFIADPNIYNEWLSMPTVPLHLYRNVYYHPIGASTPTTNISDIYLYTFSDAASMATALQAGNLDVAQFTTSTVGAVAGQPNILVQMALQSIQEWNEVGISQANSSQLNPARFDSDVRTALARATNKDYIVKQIYSGLGVRGDSLVSPVSPYWYDPVVGGDNLTFDLATANDILNVSGYTVWSGGVFGSGHREAAAARVVSYQPPCYECLNPPNGTVLIPAGTALTFTLAVRPASQFPEELTTAEYLQSQWAQVGVQITIKQESTESALAADVYGGKVEMYIWYWSSDPDPNYILSMESSWTLDGWNDNYWNNASYNHAYLQQLADLGTAQRLADAKAAQKIQYEAASYLIYIFPYGTWAMRTGLWQGWGDWAAHPYRQLNVPWGANPLFFDLSCPNCSSAPTNYPPAAPVISPGGPLGVYTNASLSFNATTSEAETYDTLNWTWEWGDGTFSYVNGTPNPTGVVTVAGAHAWAQPGNFTVSVTVSDGVNGPVPTASPVTVNVINPGPPIGTIRGAVTNAYGTAPIAGAVVTASPGGYSNVTAADGSYSLTVPAGTYTVNASAPLYVTGTSPDVIVGSGATAYVFFALGFDGAWIAGGVTDSVTGLPISGASIAAVSMNGTTTSGASDGQGHYNLTVLSGIYSVSASAPGHTTSSVTGFHALAGQTNPLSFALAPTATPVAASLSGALGRPGQPITLSGSITATVSGNWTLHFGDGATATGTYAAGTTAISESHTYATQANRTAQLFATTGADMQVAAAAILVDGTAPSTTYALAGSHGTGAWYRSSVEVTLTATDLQSGVASTTYRIDGSGWTAYAGAFAVSGDGNHTVQFRSTDNAGNVEAAATLTISIDTTPPSVSGLSPASAATVTTSDVALIWSASDAASGIASETVSVDNGTPVAVTGITTTLHGLADGAHQVTLRVTDGAGNTASVVFTFTVRTGSVGTDTVVLGGIVAAVLVVAAVAAFLVVRRRRNARGPPRNPPGT